MTMGFSIYFLVIAFVLVKVTRMPWKDVGITLRNTGPALRECLWVTVLILLILTGLKYWLTLHPGIFKGASLFDTSTIGLSFLTYALIAPIQEFITRGVLQGIVERIIGGKHDWIWAIIVSSTMFGAFHVYYSQALAILTIVSGFLWGYLYSRNRNLIGVSLSHFVVGNYLILLGFWSAVLAQ
jgi:membrane protease YdiL (CAAX protease family)